MRKNYKIEIKKMLLRKFNDMINRIDFKRKSKHFCLKITLKTGKIIDVITSGTPSDHRYLQEISANVKRQIYRI